MLVMGVVGASVLNVEKRGEEEEQKRPSRRKIYTGEREIEEKEREEDCCSDVFCYLLIKLSRRIFFLGNNAQKATDAE